MSFQAPLLLLGLLALPLAAFAYWRRQRTPPRDALRFPGAATLAAVLPRRPAWRRHLPAALFALALVGLLVAVARPQRSVAVPVRQASVVLVIDTSRSMLADDVGSSRLDAVRNAAQRFLDRVPDRTKVGLVAFSDAPHTVIAPTTDHDTVRDQIERLEADGGTATGDALATALDTLAGRNGKGRRRNLGAVILLSDGKRTVGQDPLDVAPTARRLRVPVYTVALGEPGTVIEVPGTSVILPVPPDPDTMRALARATRGRFFAVKDSDRLTTVYERLGSRLGSRSEERQITAAFAGAGALLLLAAGALSVRRFGLLP